MSLCVPNQLFLTLLLIFVVVSTRRLHNRLYPRSSSQCSPRAIATITDPKRTPHRSIAFTLSMTGTWLWPQLPLDCTVFARTRFMCVPGRAPMAAYVLASIAEPELTPCA